MTHIVTQYGTFKEEDLKSIKEALNEISNELDIISQHKDAIKDVINAVFDNYKIPKKVIRRLAKAHHKNSFQEELAHDSEFETLYIGLTEAK